jgi:hypothetical protein
MAEIPTAECRSCQHWWTAAEDPAPRTGRCALAETVSSDYRLATPLHRSTAWAIQSGGLGGAVLVTTANHLCNQYAPRTAGESRL